MPPSRLVRDYGTGVVGDRRTPGGVWGRPHTLVPHVRLAAKTVATNRRRPRERSIGQPNDAPTGAISQQIPTNDVPRVKAYRIG
jgi:hypothetical protein